MSARAHEIEHAIEQTLVLTLHRAEESLAKRVGLRTMQALRSMLRIVGWALVLLWFAAGGLVLAARYWVLPHIDQHRPRMESIATRMLGTAVSIGSVEASWRGLNPQLALNDVRVGGAERALALPRIEAVLSWTSMAAAQVRFARLRILAPELDVALLADGTVSVAGLQIDPASRGDAHGGLDWLLNQGEITISDARVRLRDERGPTPRELQFQDMDLVLVRGWGSHRFGINAAPPSSFAAPFEVRGRFTHSPFEDVTDFAKWRGEIFAQFDYVDLAQLNLWLHLPVETRHAHGALRGWLKFDRGELTRIVADLALKDVDVRLARDLEALQLESLQGRISQLRWGSEFRGGQEYGATALSFRTAAGEEFSPIDLSVRLTRSTPEQAARTEIRASRIDLAALSSMASHIPFADELRVLAQRRVVAGRLSNLDISWDGPQPEIETMKLKVQFTGMANAAAPAPAAAAAASASVPAPAAATQSDQTQLPHFENLSGTIELNAGVGRLQLASRDAAITLPGVFAEPRLAFGQLNATLQWKHAPQFELRVDSLTASNEDLEVSAEGSWRKDTGRGVIDLNGRIVRLNAARAHRYVPLIAGDKTLAWLQHGIVAGRGVDGSFRVRGALARFPFVQPADGDFRAALTVRDATLDVAPGVADDGTRRAGAVWPLLSDINAQLVFERNAMTITADRGRAGGARIERAVVRIPELGHAASLEVQGQASGALLDMFGYVNGSPVAGWIGGFTRGVEARGNARLDLKMSIPLSAPTSTPAPQPTAAAQTAQTGAKVAGTLQLAGNDLVLAGIPPFARVNGSINFSERGVRFSNVSAGFLGGTARLDAQPRADGATVVTAAGNLTPAGLRRLSDSALVERIVDRTQGSARYSASVTINQGLITLQADSDLVGFAVDGVAPLRKTAAESLPLRIERTMRDANADELRLNAGRLLAIRLERQRVQGEWRMGRGVVAVNEPANLPESGLLLNVAVARLDVEAWTNWLIGPTPEPAPGTRPQTDDAGLDYVALRTPELIFLRRTFRNVTLGASRTAESGFDVNLASDGIVGYIGWRAAAGGRITARLSKLVIPSTDKDEVVDVLSAPTRQIPAIDISAENFELGSSKLGRLDLVAQNSGTGAGAVWRLRRLDIANPDMKLAASGEWVPAGSNVRRMNLKFTLDATDVGGALTRLGYAQTVARGNAQLTGEVDWFGSPLDIDYPSLSGKLQLRVDNGRFLKVDTGNAGRLLGLLSLQSISRVLTDTTLDSFGEGFAFSTIRADAAIARGVLSTQNFRMAGASAAVLMSGSIDLRKETQELRLVVLPEVDTSTAALALTVVNPLIGIGAFLAQTLLRDPLSKAFALEYDITGTWANPVIARRSRIAPPSEAGR